MQVDWRNRFGWPWISSIRWQGGSNNCWAFAMTSLYEAMVRIEHSVWCRRSEGETVRSTGKDYRSLGNLGEASIAAQRYGVADPDCFPWTTAVALYLSRPHGADLQDLPVAPTPDRVGRTVRFADGSFTTLTDVAQKKQWIDAVGPMAAMFVPPPDFNGYGGGIYVPTQPGTGIAHAVLVVGFDDNQACWIVKNSWGTGWGEGGYARIGYAANIIEPAELVGLRNTSPDPLTRRRLRSGGLLQSSNGAVHDNLELFVRCGNKLEQWFRNTGVSSPWQRVGTITNSDPYSAWHGDDVLDAPAAIQSTFNRNFEIVYRSTAGRLHHIHFDQAFSWWIDDDWFGPSDAVGVPALVQGNRGAPADFEVVVATQRGTLQHWSKQNSYPWTQPPGTWSLRQEFGSGVAFSGPGLVASRLGAIASVLEDGRGELHHVCGEVSGRLAHYRRTAGGPWQLVSTFGSGITSAPCVIEGQYGAADELDAGNFELCVVAGGQIEHWWRDNHGTGGWTRSAVFGGGLRRVVGLVEGSGFNLELVAEQADGRYQHFWRDGAGWHAGAAIVCKDAKDGKDTKDTKDAKDSKEDDKLLPKETDKLRPKEMDKMLPKELDVASPPQTPPDAESVASGSERPFIADRPQVGGEAVEEPAWSARGQG